MDAKISITDQFQGPGFYVAQFKSVELAIFSYYVQSNGQSLLIDPTLDTKIYTQIIQKRNSGLTSVLLTHYHADFLAGHTQFNVPIIMGPNSKKEVNKYKIVQMQDGSSFNLGNIKINIIHTPGHTLQSSCFLLQNSEGKKQCIFTGDTVFLGDVGRPDLAVKGNITTQDLAGMLFDSVSKLKLLQDHLRIYPAHGSGSACGKAIGTGNFCTLGQQKVNNYALKITQKSEFVKQLTTGIVSPPKYFFYDAMLNQNGPGNFDEILKKSNIPLTLQQFNTLRQKVAIIDTRDDIKNGIIKGSYWLPQKGAISNWLANIITPQQPYIIISQKNKWSDIAERFFRIGYHNLQGYNNFDISQWKQELSVPKIITFQGLHNMNQYQHLDVRNKPQFINLGIVQKSILIPLPQLPSRSQQLKNHNNLVISCRSGLRARVAYSILLRHGINSTILSQNFDKFAQNKLKVIPYTQ